MRACIHVRTPHLSRLMQSCFIKNQVINKLGQAKTLYPDVMRCISGTAPENTLCVYVTSLKKLPAIDKRFIAAFTTI